MKFTLRTIAFKRFAIVTSGLFLAGGSLTLGANSVSAAQQDDIGIQATCLGDKRAYVKPANYRYYPLSGYYSLVTSNLCNDINFQVLGSASIGRSVRVCFAPRASDPYCQANYTYAAPGEWTVIASNVADGTHYRFQFQTLGGSAGYYAD